MKQPLHISKIDTSLGSNSARIDLHVYMQSLVRTGFRLAPSSKKGSKSLAKQKSKKPYTRIEKLAQLVYGKEGQYNG